MAIDFDALSQSQAQYADNLANMEAVSSKTLEQVPPEELAIQINQLPMTTVGQLEIIVNEFIARRDNPNEVTKRQVGLGDVANYPIATELDMIQGTHASYVTPQLVKSAFTQWLSDFAAGGGEGDPEGPDLSGILQAIEDLQTALGGMPTDLTELLNAIGEKLGKTETAVDSAKFEGYTVDEFLTQLLPDTIEEMSLNAFTFNGRSFEQMVANWADWLSETPVTDKFVTPALLRQIQEDQVDPLLDHLTYLFSRGADYMAGNLSHINPMP